MRRPTQAKRWWKEIVIDAAHRRKQVVVVVKNVVGVKERTERIACSKERLKGLSRISVELVGEVWGVVTRSIWSVWEWDKEMKVKNLWRHLICRGLINEVLVNILPTFVTTFSDSKHFSTEVSNVVELEKCFNVFFLWI